MSDSPQQEQRSPPDECAFGSPAVAPPPPPPLLPEERPESSTGRRSPSPAESRAAKAASRRQIAAEWITAQTDIEVPHATDAAFRQSLRDGVTLCRLLNTLRPGSINKIIECSMDGSSSAAGDVIQTFENVTNFIKAVKQFTGDSTCSAADLEDVGERPQVADCILALHAWWQQQQQNAAQPARSPSPFSSASSGRGSVTPTPTALRVPPSPTEAPTSEFSFTPHAATAVNRAAGQQRTDGLEYLMRTCNHMLKTHMGLPATPLPPPPRNTSSLHPEIALDAVGPVLETVLQSLTAEYEKRLLAKDQEFKLSQEAQERMKRDIARLKQEVAHWKEQAANVKYLPAPDSGLNDEERQEYEQRLRAKEEETAAEVARKEAELRQVQQAAEQLAAEADEKLSELSHEVENYRGLNERYRQISEENRQLYNTVQDLRGNIRVFCRVRPRGLTGDSTQCMVEVGDDGIVNVFSNKHNKWHPFKFDRVFPEGSNQDEVYQESQPLIRSVLDGYNVCIFAYGQTGSGKTHTMSGTDIEQYANRGIYYRSLDDLFDLNRQRQDEVEYSITVQLLEIYNENLRDLLVSEAEARQQRSLQIVNSQRSGFNVPDAIQVPVSCTEDVLEVMERGARNRAVAETKMNNRSSRSHQVLTVMVDGTNKITHARTHGCLHLIDLAGSERVGKSGAEGQQLLEAQHINKSLSALGNVMHALASKNSHVPFRDSKLTQLLQDSLSGQAKTMMFMHIAPEMSSVSETLSTLNFGKGVTEITLGAAKKNAESGAAFEAKERAMKLERDAAAAKSALAAEQERSAVLQAELEELRAQLARSVVSRPAEDEGNIRAFRPAVPRLAPTAAGQSGSGGLTPRSRTSQPAAPSSSGRLTPRGGPASNGGSRGLTPRGTATAGATPPSASAGGRQPVATPSSIGGSGMKPPPVGGSTEKRVAAPAAVGGMRPPMAKLNLQKLQRADAEENKTPLSARVSPVGAAATASSTPRTGNSTPRSTNWLMDACDVGAGSVTSSPTRVSDSCPLAEEVEEDTAFQITVSPQRRRISSSSSQPAAAASAGAMRPGARVPRLPLSAARPNQQSPAERQKLPATSTTTRSRAQGLSSRIPGPTPSPPSGSTSARLSLKQSPGFSSIPVGPMSARESPAEATARRAALQKGTASSNLRRAAADSAAAARQPAASSMRRSASGSSEASSNGTLNSARGVRSSIAAPTGSRRWG